MSISGENLSRRTLLRTASASAATAALGRPTLSTSDTATARLFRELDAKIEQGLAAFAIPGAAVGVLYRGVEYVKGYGVTNVDYPRPVDGDTVFRIGSTTKTFTGTTVMRLVEQGRIELDAPVRRYLPDFQTSDPSVAPRVTVRQLLNHTAGWLGDDLQDTGPGDDAAARYVAGMVRLPQLTPPGTVFGYNNAAVELAGRIVEVVTGAPYEAATRALLIDPLGLAHSRYFPDEIIGFNVAASHNVVNGRAVVAPDFYRVPRSLAAAGGLISSARDQLRYARFHLGDGSGLLTRRSLVEMRSHPGPGGTLFVELDGVGVNWMLRPSAQGVRVVQHGGDWPGQHSGFLMVPDRGFAITLLTNSEGGPALVDELFADDWALRRFAGLTNLPAVPRSLTPAQLAPYEGVYTQQEVLPDGTLVSGAGELVALDGGLALRAGGADVFRLVFYRHDYVLLRGPNGEPTPLRANFVRDPAGRVAWLRVGGRLLRHEAAAPATAAPVRPINPLRPWLAAVPGN